MPDQGVSIVELLIGIAIGLFVLAGATMVTANQLGDNRKLLLETQIQQDLRAAMDIITRDIRRSGYWSNAYQSVAPASLQSNPYSSAGTSAASPDTLFYTRSHDADTSPDTGSVEDNEQNGFKFNASTKTIDVKLGAGNFQALTDPSVVHITAFTALVSETPIELPVCAAPPCAMVSPVGPLTAACDGKSRLIVRKVTVAIEGKAVHDPSVKRSLTNTVRLRNDQVCQ